MVPGSRCGGRTGRERLGTTDAGGFNPVAEWGRVHGRHEPRRALEHVGERFPAEHVGDGRIEPIGMDECRGRTCANSERSCDACNAANIANSQPTGVDSARDLD